MECDVQGQAGASREESNLQAELVVSRMQRLRSSTSGSRRNSASEEVGEPQKVLVVTLAQQLNKWQMTCLTP